MSRMGRLHVTNRSPCTILLVEEDVFVRRVVQRGLTRRGYRVLIAGNGGSTLRLLLMNRGRIHVVVSSIAIPLVDNTTRYLFTSARLGDAARAARARPGTAFLAKPWTITELETSIVGLLALPHACEV
jgi:DNA-binding response OmpR family regulator